MTPLRFPSVDEPLVSVVMVTYGNWPLVRRSLEALLERTDPVYEVIVVDSASPDETAQRLSDEVEGASLVLSQENVGFGGGSNVGAEQARGRFLCFLNSDAIVEPGWLDPLIEMLEEDPTAGAAIPMFLNPDGTIQEAGSVIDSVGWPHALGAGESAEGFRAPLPARDRLRVGRVPADRAPDLLGGGRVRPGLRGRLLRGRRPLPSSSRSAACARCTSPARESCTSGTAPEPPIRRGSAWK